jgi:hypothetical protein
MGVVEEFSKSEGGTRDTRLYYLMVSTHCMVVTDSSMDIYFGIFRFYMEAHEEELILSTSLQSQYFILGNSPRVRLEICRLATRACINANVLSFRIESSFPLP